MKMHTLNDDQIKSLLLAALSQAPGLKYDEGSAIADAVIKNFNTPGSILAKVVKEIGDVTDNTQPVVNPTGIIPS